MTRATLYTLLKSDIRARPGQSYITMQDRSPAVFYEGAGRIALRHIPIRQWRDADGKDSFFAVDDEMQRVADILFDEERKILAAAHERIARFNALPWFKRVWRAMRGGL